MENQIERAGVDDLAVILELQKAAFRGVAEMETNFNIPPMIQTYENIVEEFKEKVFLKYAVAGRIVGSVRAYVDADGICQIGRLVVHPEHMNKGIGRRLMSEIEGIFRECRQYALFTGKRSENTLYLYKKLGYAEVSEGNMGGVDMVFMKKDNPIRYAGKEG